MDGLKDFRDAVGVSQEALAAYLGVSRNTICNWEQCGEKLSTEQRQRLYDAGANLLFIDIRIGDYLREGYSIRQARETILGGAQ